MPSLRCCPCGCLAKGPGGAPLPFALRVGKVLNRLSVSACPGSFPLGPLGTTGPPFTINPELVTELLQVSAARPWA